jgi:ferritin-like metal-binding protein YciE
LLSRLKRFWSFPQYVIGISTANACRTLVRINQQPEKNMSTLREAFIETLKDTYDAEHQIIEALPKVIEHVEDEDLQEALESHLEETRKHAKRLEQVFEAFRETPKRKECAGMAGLIAEGEVVMEEDEGEAATILALQKVEHYEIAAYGALVSWAKLLKQQKAATILQETLAEEKEADEKLNDIAESIINLEEQSEGEQRKAA